jgi:hypothetical protein
VVLGGPGCFDTPPLSRFPITLRWRIRLESNGSTNSPEAAHLSDAPVNLIDFFFFFSFWRRRNTVGNSFLGNEQQHAMIHIQKFDKQQSRK